MKAIGRIKQMAIGAVILGFVVALPMVGVAAGVESVDILDYGLYKTGFDRWKAAPATTRGKIGVVEARELLELTETIPATAGTEFGIRYVIHGKKAGKKVRLLVKVLHAEMHYSNQWTVARQVGTPSFDGWKFDSDLQIAPGNLTIQLFHQGTKLAEKSFTLY